MDENEYSKVERESSFKYPFLKSLRKNAIKKLDRDNKSKLNTLPENKADSKSLDLKMAQRLIEELQVYQVELELQNEELRDTQQKLEQSRDQFAELYHEAPVGYVTLDEGGRVIKANRMAGKMLGYEAGHLIERPFSAYVARIDSNKYFDFLNSVFNEKPIGEPSTTELLIRKANLRQSHVELRAVLRLEMETGRRLCRLVIQDIEERKTLEEQQRLLQAAVEYSTDGISISDMRQLDNPIIYASPKLSEISGYQIDELEGGNWRMLYEEEPDEEARQLLREALSLGREVRTTVRNIRKDGSPFLCEVTLYPLTDSNGMVTHYVSVLRDITEKQKTDQAILQAQRLDSIGVLAGGIAHDFNNILQGVMVQSTLALQRIGEEHPAQKNIAKALQSTRRAADLTRQLLSYAGRGNFEVTHVDVNSIIPDTYQLISSSVPSDIRLETDLSEEPLLIEADMGQIQQILLNLIMNAAEAIEPRGTISVRSKKFKAEPHNTNNHVIQNGEASGQLNPRKVYALIEVEDDGCGMDEETIPRIYDPFFTTKELGHGLGLAAALGVVRTHDGTIQVESRHGIGTKFSVFLPLFNEHLVETKAAPTHYDDDLIPGEPTVLIVDDDVNVRETLDSALDFLGCTVISAEDGMDGIEKFKDNLDRIDLVVMDFHMPGMDGEETYGFIHKLRPHVRCIFSSGFAPDKTRKNIGDGDGRIEYLQKPYDLQTLKNTIIKVLD
ncbi:MAG: PAS domain S-box protein [Chloroflexota bacterium]